MFDLAPGWALGADNVQWIIMRLENRQAGDRRSAWKPVSFISTTREVLERVICERGITVTPMARAKVAALPVAFERESIDG
jgi:hypothetical protein